MDRRIEKQKEKYIGQTFTTNEGYTIMVTDYLNNREVEVEFLGSDCRVWCELVAIRDGRVKNPLHRSVFGIGYIGVGDYKVSVNSRPTKEYLHWSGCIERCYDSQFLLKNPTYENCSVCEEWHSFQNFAKWYEENYYEIEGERMELDKDILVKGNKVYSPETCVFVPNRINLFLNKRQNLRGSLPIGVTYKSGDTSRFVSRCNNPLTGIREYLGVYNTPEEAFYTYKSRKEAIAKELANYYQFCIPTILYEALVKYRVDIND